MQVNADLKVGTLEETITVTGETPVVDVQNAARQQILSGDLVANTPAAKSWNGIMLLMPGVTGDQQHGAAHARDGALRHPRRTDAPKAVCRWTA